MTQNSKILSIVYKLTVHSAVFLGLCVMSYAVAVLSLLNQPLDPVLLITAFLAGFAPYNLNRGADVEEDQVNNPNRTNFIQRNHLIFKLIIFTSYGIILTLSILSYNPSLFLVSLFPLALVLLYTVKWMPTHNGKNGQFKRLKEIPLVKNLVVAVGWSGFVGLLIYLGSPQLLSYLPLIVMSIFIFVRLIVNTISCDLRDIDGDSKSGVVTVPVLLGYKTSIRMLFVLNVLSFVVFSFLSYGQLIPSKFLWVNLVVSLYSFGYLSLFSANVGKNILADVVVDGECIVTGIVPLLMFM